MIDKMGHRQPPTDHKNDFILDARVLGTIKTCDNFRQIQFCHTEIKHKAV